MDLDLAIKAASASANPPSKALVIEEFNNLEQRRVIDRKVRNKWVSQVEKEGVTLRILDQLHSFKQRELEILEEQKQIEAEKKRNDTARQQSLQIHNPKHVADAEVRCPKCGSNQLTANQIGYGLGKAAVGGVLLGPVGLLGGFVGSKKVLITCLRCGHSWKPGGK